MIRLTVPDIGEEELREVQKVFDSKYLVQGDKVEEFENMIKECLNVKYVMAVSSGTAALHLALLALGISSEDEVIVPNFTFPATANVVEMVGAKTKFVDIKLDSFCIDVDKIEEIITNKTKAIIPVQEFGQASDMDKILELSCKYNIKVIEDAACALDAEYKTKKVGSIGDIGCFSLHPRKAITTGEGGIIVTNDDKLAEEIKILRNHGMTQENGEIKFVKAGLNYRMTNIQGAIGVIQMKKIQKLNSRRIEVANLYSESLKNIEGIVLPEEKKYGKHVWQTYHILLDEKYNRNEIISKLKNRGIETNIGAYALSEQDYYKNKYGTNYTNLELEKSIYAYKQGVALPMHGNISIEEIAYISKQLKDILNEI